MRWSMSNTSEIRLNATVMYPVIALLQIHFSVGFRGASHPWSIAKKELHTHPVKDCQWYSHVVSSVCKVNSLGAVNQDDIVKGLHPIGITALQLDVKKIHVPAALIKCEACMGFGILASYFFSLSFWSAYESSKRNVAIIHQPPKTGLVSTTNLYSIGT